MRAIGYFRADANTQKNGAAKSSIDFRDDFAEYCDLNLHQQIKTFGDLNASGNGRYPQYDQMIEFIKESRSNFLVVIPDSTHIGSDLESVARTLIFLENNGAKVICDDEDFPAPLQNAFHVLGVTGISKTRSAKIKESMQARALKGQGLGRPPYGYRNGDTGILETVKSETAVVELIFKLYTQEDMGLRLIVQHLNERDIPTRRGGKWNVVSVRDMLKNPVYMGTYTRFGLRLPRAHEAIIPPATFREAQDTTRSRRPVGRVSRAEPFLLSGLVYCGYCDNKMMGVTRRQSWRNKDGRRHRGVYRYYQCQSRNNQSICGYHTWRAPLLEGTIVPQLTLALQAKQHNLSDSRNGNQKPELEAVWEERVKNAERRFIQMMRKTARGAAKLDELAEHLTELDNARVNAKKATSPGADEDVLANWQDVDFDQQRDFLLTHVARIVVRDEMARVEV